MKTQKIFMFMIISGLLTFLTSCAGEEGEGEVISRSVNLPEIKGFNNRINADIYLTQSPVQQITVNAQANIIDLIRLDVHNGIWDIEFEEAVRRHRKVSIYISIPDLKSAVISGSGNVYTQGAFNLQSPLLLKISGSGNIEAAVSAPEIETGISGSGSVRLSGYCNRHDITVSGSGDVNAFDCSTLETKVKISGSGSCYVTAAEKLSVNISGSGDVYYRGNPALDYSVSSSGRLINDN